MLFAAVLALGLLGGGALARSVPPRSSDARFAARMARRAADRDHRSSHPAQRTSGLVANLVATVADTLTGKPTPATTTSVFSLQRQPFKMLYVLLCIIDLCALKVPAWTLRNLLPSWRPRPSWPLSWCIHVKLTQYYLALSSRFVVFPSLVKFC